MLRRLPVMVALAASFSSPSAADVVRTSASLVAPDEGLHGKGVGFGLALFLLAVVAVLVAFSSSSEGTPASP